MLKGPKTVKMNSLRVVPVATMMPSSTELSGYVLEPIRESADFTLYRGRQHGNPSPVLVVALTGHRGSFGLVQHVSPK
jgi:hypothetical protein